MKSNPKPSNPPAFKPRARFEPVVIRQADGDFLVRPGKPIVVNASDDEEMTTAAAAKELGLSQRRVQDMCDAGIFVEGIDWRRPGGVRGKYFIKRSAVARQKNFTNGGAS